MGKNLKATRALAGQHRPLANGADGISDIEGKAAIGSGEQVGTRASFNGADMGVDERSGDRDRWTLLVSRDLFYGRTRFKEFAASPEGIPTNILTDRLERLLARGIIEQIPAEDGTKRLAYRLTKKGKALGPVLKAMRDWGLTWDKSTRVLA